MLQLVFIILIVPCTCLIASVPFLVVLYVVFEYVLSSLLEIIFVIHQRNTQAQGTDIMRTTQVNNTNRSSETPHPTKSWMPLNIRQFSTRQVKQKHCKKSFANYVHLLQKQQNQTTSNHIMITARVLTPPVLLFKIK